MAATQTLDVAGMSAALFSQSWYLIRDLRVHLRRHVDVHRHLYRGRVWYVLQDHATGQFHRFTPEAYKIIGLFDGEQTLQQVWEKACVQLGDDMPSQDEIVDLVSSLFRANVLQSDVMPDIQKLDYRRRTQARNKFLQQLKSPLSIKIPFWDPETFLNRTMVIARILFSVWGGLLWLGVCIYALTQAGINWQALSSNPSDRILATENLLLLTLIYPVVKAVHELGHAWAVKRWGGEVHEIGVMFLVFFPVPYVDASAATAFRNRYQRMLVGAAGILVEVFIASVAMLFWVSAEPGLARSIAFNTMLIAGVSTVLFNGNPLLKFDAYYVLADWLEIPNFGQKANKYVGYLARRYLAGVEGLRSPAKTVSERFWLAGYSIIAFVYRLVVMMAIALFIATEYFFIGGVLAFWLLYMSIIHPVAKVAVMPVTDAKLKQKKSRILAVTATVFSSVAGLLLFVPFPYTTVAEGVLKPSEESVVRANTEGFVEKVLLTNGATVEDGDLLVTMKDPVLNAQTVALKARVSEARASYQSSLTDRVESALNRELLQYTEEEYQNAVERRDTLNVFSNVGGRFVIHDADSLTGQYFKRGDSLGYVVDFASLPVTVMIHEDNIEQVRTGTQSVQVRKISGPEQLYQGNVLRIVPASSTELPSAVLTTRGGGGIALAADAGNELRSQERYFRLELAVPELTNARLDERLYIVFEHAPEPVVKRWFRAVRRVFLRQFDV